MKSTELISTILFDWDGTIVDTAQLGLNAYRKVFAEMDCEFSEEIYQASYSPNWYATYEALGLPHDKWDAADARWRFHYDRQSPTVMRDAHETVTALADAGFRLGLVSSGNDDRVTREIQQFGFAHLFEVVLCHEHITRRKPDPEGLQMALTQLGCQAAQCAYVGDAPEDIQMGKQAKVMTIAVRGNYPCSSRLASAGPDLLLDSIGELRQHFRSPRPAQFDVRPSRD